MAEDEVPTGGAARDESEAADVRQIWKALGLPGIIDVHTRFMPESSCWTRCGRLLTPPAHCSAGVGRSPTAPTRPVAWICCAASVFGDSPRWCIRTNADGRMAESVGGRVSQRTSRTACPPRRSIQNRKPASMSLQLCAAAPASSKHTYGSALRSERPAARRGVGNRWGTLEVQVVIHCGSGPVPRGIHRARAHPPPAAPSPASAVGHRAPGNAGIRRILRHLRAIRARPPGHHDGVHLLRAGDHAVPAVDAASATTAGRPDSVRQRLPQHSLTVIRAR